MDLNSLNPEINYKGRNFKISLVSLAALIFGVSQTPSAMVLLGVNAATAEAIPAAVKAVVSAAAPVVGALFYNLPKATDQPK